MDVIDQCMRQVALYPRWMVITGAAIALIFIFWIVAKLLKWALVLFLIFSLVIIVGGVLLGWLG
jgi:hypothetical protein